MDPDAGEKAYAVAQRYKTWDLEELASHISSHNCKYNRADVHAVLTSLVDCIREQLLNGISVQLGEMGTFYIVLRSKGVSVEEESEYSASNITAVRVGWRRGSIFQELLDDAQFMQVASRSLQQEAKEKMNEIVFGTSSSSSSSSEEARTVARQATILVALTRALRTRATRMKVQADDESVCGPKGLTLYSLGLEACLSCGARLFASSDGYALKECEKNKKIDGGNTLWMEVFEGFAVDAADGDGDATEGGDEAAVAGDADTVALEACEGSRDDAHKLMSLGIVLQFVLHETYAGGGYLRSLHEGLHDTVRNLRHLVSGAVAGKTDAWVTFAEEGLHSLRLALHEEETGDGGTLMVADTLLLTVVDDVGVHEGWEVVGKSLGDVFHASTHVEVTPRGGGAWHLTEGFHSAKVRKKVLGVILQGVPFLTWDDDGGEVEARYPIAVVDTDYAVLGEVHAVGATDDYELTEHVLVVHEGELVLSGVGGETYGDALVVISAEGVGGKEDVARVVGRDFEEGVLYGAVGAADGIAHHPALGSDLRALPCDEFVGSEGMSLRALPVSDWHDDGGLRRESGVAVIALASEECEKEEEERTVTEVTHGYSSAVSARNQRPTKRTTLRL